MKKVLSIADRLIFLSQTDKKDVSLTELREAIILKIKKKSIKPD
ncbi:MAG: hypothetical protein ABJA66_04325 [Actinomycetota bacterium]